MFLFISHIDSRYTLFPQYMYTQASLELVTQPSCVYLLSMYLRDIRKDWSYTCPLESCRDVLLSLWIHLKTRARKIKGGSQGGSVDEFLTVQVWGLDVASASERDRGAMEERQLMLSPSNMCYCPQARVLRHISHEFQKDSGSLRGAL